MTEKKDNIVKKRMGELAELLRYHNKLYFENDDPKISDAEYDKLSLELRKLEEEYPEFADKNSPTLRVGGALKRELGVSIPHRVPMLSIRDVFEKEEVLDFIEDVETKLGKNTEFVVETKIDGLSLSLRYEEGQLTTALTRGDGREAGEDVTANAMVISDIKHSIKDAPPYLELRGEVYMEESKFEAVNERQELLGKKKFANSRNCAAGTLRQLDTRITKARGLSMFVFNLQDVEGKSFTTHIEFYDYLKSIGIKTIEHYFRCKNSDEVMDAIDKIADIRGELRYDIDGAVVKINNLEDRKKFPDTSKNSGYMIAYKYPPEEKESIIRDIEVSVGRTGKLTPTAIFDTVRLCGTAVSRATLHNQDYIDELDVGIGDTVVVYKSGEIIPKIKSVNKKKRKAGTVRFQLPSVCPICGAAIVREKDTADMRCTGSSCPAQLWGRIVNFVGRSAMDIKGFGEVYVSELINKGFLRDVADIYSLKDKRDELIELGIIGKEKNTDKLLSAIEASKENDGAKLLTGLGISNVGKTAAKSLLKNFRNIENLEKADLNELVKVKDIGDITAISILEFFKDEKNRSIIDRLKDAGVNMESKEGIGKYVHSKFTDKTVVITGKFQDIDRNSLTEFLEKMGADIKGSVSKKTDFLVAGENAGSKLEKAKQLEIQIINEKELMEEYSKWENTYI